MSIFKKSKSIISEGDTSSLPTDYVVYTDETTKQQTMYKWDESVQQAYPISHPDISTQPSRLSQKIGDYDTYEILIPLYNNNIEFYKKEADSSKGKLLCYKAHISNEWLEAGIIPILASVIQLSNLKKEVNNCFPAVLCCYKNTNSSILYLLNPGNLLYILEYKDGRYKAVEGVFLLVQYLKNRYSNDESSYYDKYDDYQNLYDNYGQGQDENIIAPDVSIASINNDGTITVEVANELLATTYKTIQIEGLSNNNGIYSITI